MRITERYYLEQMRIGETQGLQKEKKNKSNL